MPKSKKKQRKFRKTPEPSSAVRQANPIQRIRRLMDALQWNQAWTELQPILKAEPHNPSLQWVAGILQNELGRHEKARESLRFAARHIQDEPHLFYLLSNLEQQLGDTVRAREAVDRALSLGVSAEALVALARVHQASGQRALEIQALEQAFELNPQNHEVALRLAHVHQECFDPERALDWAIRAVKVKEDYWVAYMAMGNALQSLGRYKEALEVYHSLILVDPKDSATNRNLGVMCVLLGLNDQAIRYYERSAEGKADTASVECEIVHQMLYTSAWADVATRLPRALEKLRNTTETVAPFGLLSLPGLTPMDFRVTAERAANQIVRNLKGDPNAFARSVQPGEADRRLKIGYLSSDLHDHATGYLMARLFELHDREQFSLHAYTWDKDESTGLRERLVKSFDVVRDIRGVADPQAAELIRRDEIDILVDLKGYTYNGRLPIMAYRPAPVGVHHVGFPGTLGASFIDYLVADRFVAPPENPEHFTESVAYLPDCYQPNDDQREIGERPSRLSCGLPETGVVFCCFNQTYKFTPDVFDLWCELLNDVPGSVLWLWGRAEKPLENLRAWAERRGVAPERLIPASSLPQKQHLARLQNADIMLDTLPVNAHTTASDALWAGVPVVTRPGEAFVARVAGSILQTMGLPELIARDEREYVAIAKELATRPELLESTKARIRAQRTQSALFDSARYTKNLEQLYREMWRRRANGLAPATIGA